VIINTVFVCEKRGIVTAKTRTTAFMVRSF
jgi:hypothetical protein